MKQRQKFRLVKCHKRLVSVSAGILLISQLSAAPIQVMAESLDNQTQQSTQQIAPTEKLDVSLSKESLTGEGQNSPDEAQAKAVTAEATSGNVGVQTEGITTQTELVNEIDKVVDGGSGTIILAAGFEEITFTIEISNKNITIESAAGVTMKRANENRLSVFKVTDGGSLTLENVTVDGNELNKSILGDSLISLNSNSKFTLVSGVIENGATNTGGAIEDRYLNSTVEIQDGIIRNNRAANGGGIYAGNVIMSGGSIVNNVGTSNGGGISAKNVEMKDGTISNNTAGQDNGGGIYSWSGEVIIKGGSISNNTAGYSGGGIYAEKATIEGGIISTNSAGEGSAIAMNIDYGSLPTITGGLIFGEADNYPDLVRVPSGTWAGPTGTGVVIAKTNSGPYEWEKGEGLDTMFGPDITKGEAKWTIQKNEELENKVGVLYSSSNTAESFLPVEGAQINLNADMFKEVAPDPLTFTGMEQALDSKPLEVNIANDDLIEVVETEVTPKFKHTLNTDADSEKLVNAGTYEVFAEVSPLIDSSTNLLNGSAKVGNVTINKATPAQANFNYPKNVSIYYNGRPLDINNQIRTTFPTLEDFSIKYIKDHKETDTMNGPGKYKVKIIVDETSNFNATNFTLTDTTITVSGDLQEADVQYTLPENAVYNGAAQGVDVEVKDYNEAEFGEITVTYATVGSENFTSDIPKNAGSYQVKIETAGGEVYNPFTKTDQYTIAKKAVTGKIQDEKITQGDTLPPITITYDGFVEGEQLADIFQEIPTAKYAVENSQTPGTTAITLDKEGIQKIENYALTFTPGTLTIAEKTVTPSPDPEPTPEPEPEEDRLPLYRVYNPNNGEHLYTLSQSEAQGLIDLGWQDEGIGWYGGKTTGKAVYRLYNQNSGEHFYTLDAGEYENVAQAGWMKEGVAFYAVEDTEIPIYRVFNPNSQDAGSHHYTLSSMENTWLISEGWRAEGVAFYGK